MSWIGMGTMKPWWGVAIHCPLLLPFEDEHNEPPTRDTKHPKLVKTPGGAAVLAGETMGPRNVAKGIRKSEITAW
ncbi:unnamed protein product, partial [Mesorhabditis spiculigera]